MSPHVRVIDPVCDSSWVEATRAVYAHHAGPDIEVSVASLEWGVRSIEGYADAALVTPDIIDRAIRAERDGAQAVIIDCFADPGIEAARECVSVPVIGPGESTIRLALARGGRFSILAVTQAGVSLLRDRVTLYSARDRLASVRAIEVPVLELEHDGETTARALATAAEQAVRADGAELLIAGCTLMGPALERAAALLAERGIEVPILEPTSAAMHAAKAALRDGTKSARPSGRRPGPRARWPVERSFCEA